MYFCVDCQQVLEVQSDDEQECNLLLRFDGRSFVVENLQF